jgi:hypothetical protein
MKSICFLFAFALASALSAQTVTRLLDSTAVVGPLGYTENYSLDINLDSVIDFQLIFETIDMGLGVEMEIIKIMPEQTPNLVRVLDSTSGRALLLDNGTMLDTTGIWLNFIPTFTHWNITNDWNTGPAANDYHYDPFECKYIGLQFQMGANLHFGWLRIEKDVLGAQKLTLKEVGYEQTPATSLSTETTCLITARAAPEEKTFRAYPNPTTGILRIDLVAPPQNDQFEIYDVLGNLQAVPVKTKGSTAILDFQELAKGIYFVRILENRQITSLKVVKE